MFPFVENLNPCKTCLSIGDFDDALLEIQSLLKQGETSSGQANKQSILENAFKLAYACLHATRKSNPDKQLALLFAEILRQYASLYYKEDIFTAKQILLASLGCHLYGIQLFSDCIDMRDFHSLNDLKLIAQSRPLLFSALEQSIFSMHGDTCMTRAYKSSFIQQDSQKNLFLLAETIRGFGHCCQHLTANAQTDSRETPSFQPLLRLSESLLLLAQNEDSHHALADLYVQARPYLHSQPQDAAELEHFYDICLSYDSSAEMRARVARQHFLVLSNNGYRAEALSHIHVALNIVATLQENDYKFALLAELCNDYAKYLMHPENPDVTLAEQLLETSINYTDQCRASGRDCFSFALYDISSAELHLLKGKLETAKNFIERALTTLHKYPYQQEALLIKAEALKSLIHKTTIE